MCCNLQQRFVASDEDGIFNEKKGFLSDATPRESAKRHTSSFKHKHSKFVKNVMEVIHQNYDIRNMHSQK